MAYMPRLISAPCDLRSELEESGRTITRLFFRKEKVSSMSHLKGHFNIGLLLTFY